MHSFLAFFGPIGWPELLVILVLVLVVFGPRRLPEIADAMGKSIRKFRESSREATREVQRELNETKRSLDDAKLDETRRSRDETDVRDKAHSDDSRP
jgi:TatA/E family protein of Tat protein translocase